MVIEKKESKLASRKFWFALLLCFLLFGEAYIASKQSAVIPALDTVIGGQIAIFGLYSGANVTASWITGRKSKSPVKK